VLPGPEELERLGLYDPSAPDAQDRLELIHYALERGARLDEVATAPHLGELALDLHLRPRLPRTLREVVEDAGLEWPRAHRLLTAVGFPSDPDGDVTADEAATIQLLATVSDDLLGEVSTVQIARVAGSAMARVAETVVGTFRLQFELPRRAGGTRYIDVVKEYAQVAETLLPAFTRSLDVMLRRQIVAVTARMWGTDAEQSAVMLPRTVGFADLVGYTAATASMSVRELTAVLVEFDERSTQVVTRGRGQVVKTIGDETMFVTEHAGDACRIALELVREFGSGSLPPVRVGLAAGEVVSMFGDVYGPDVNLAARLVGVAAPSTVVVSEPVRASSGEGFRFERLPAVTLKGFAEPLPAWRLEP
jgi:adenylate cyclase